MSKRKDRERAESGLIFRDGRLWKREEWEALHPTREMVKNTQEGVNMALDSELQKKFGDQPYKCSKCGRTHKPGTAIYSEHLKFKEIAKEERPLVSKKVILPHPNREQRRRALHMGKRGDLSRKSQHKMRTKLGMSS